MTSIIRLFVAWQCFVLYCLALAALNCTVCVNVLFKNEGGVRVRGIAVLGYFWCGVAEIFVSNYGIAVFRVQAVCGKFKFYVAVGGEKIVVSR